MRGRQVARGEDLGTIDGQHGARADTLAHHENVVARIEQEQARVLVRCHAQNFPNWR